jgi:hypothetical protein
MPAANLFCNRKLVHIKKTGKPGRMLLPCGFKQIRYYAPAKALSLFIG